MAGAAADKPRLQLPSAAVTIQRLAVYETKKTIFIVGNDNENSVFRLIKINRESPLVIEDDKKQYTKQEMQAILNGDDANGAGQAGRKQRAMQLRKTLMAFGLLGFVKFTQGYYMVMITRRRKVAQIGGHIIYKIEDISLTEIAPEKTSSSSSAEENRYIKYFNSLDFSSNFYFSYTLDITRTIQQNMVPIPTFCDSCTDGTCDRCLIGTRVHHDFNAKFTWNMHMLRVGGYMESVAREWVIPLVYGFISQTNISVLGRSIYLTLIARRSSKYAGTRFLKRGMNESGEVANEVETEQVVHDASYTNHRFLRITSYVQLRGSVPVFWHQDTSTMVPKPQIMISRSDPFCGGAGQHFNTLLKQYGSPIYILNLVKSKEKRNHERQLTDSFVTTFNYLNQFLPNRYKIKYCGFDMSKYSKSRSKKQNVMSKLEEIATNTFKCTGFFHNVNITNSPQRVRDILNSAGLETYGDTVKGVYQTGAVRTNCVDCLDRTNTAQFVLGKVALGHQLMALGVTSNPHLLDNTPCVHSLEEIYEDHGDTMALQYGGSQLVHRIRGYRKENPWTSHSYDILNTVSRYYRNAFTDWEKQNAINLFLGIYDVERMPMSLWELTSDHYLHHQPSAESRPYTAWWDTDVWESLPLASTITAWHRTLHSHWSGEVESEGLKTVVSPFFEELYRPTMLTSFEEHYCLFMPSTATESGINSPFAEVKGKSSAGRSLSVRTKPVSTYRSSKAAVDETDSSSDTDESEEEDSVDVSEVGLEKTESVSSPVHQQPRLLAISPPVDSHLYRSYASDWAYLKRGSGTFTVKGPCYKSYSELSSKPALIADHVIGSRDQALYAKRAVDISVSQHSKQLYQSYCSLLTL